MALKRLEDDLLDVTDGLPEELLTCRVEQLWFSHNFTLSHAGHGEGDTFRSFDMFTERVQCHHLQRDPVIECQNEITPFSFQLTNRDACQIVYGILCMLDQAHVET